MGTQNEETKGTGEATQETTALKDYQQLFSARSIKNYLASFFGPFGYQGLGYVLFSTYLTMVYSTKYNVNVAAIATVLSVGIIIDGVTDFLMGIVVDRVRTKWGKAKHWFLITAVPLGLSIGLMWMVPESASSTMVLVWAFIFYNLFCTFATMIRIPTQSLGALLSDSSKVRSWIGWAIGAATTLASSVAGWVIVPIMAAYGDTLFSYRLLAWIMGIATTVLIFAAGLLITEQRTGDDWKAIDAEYKQLHGSAKRESIIDQIRFIASNRWWLTMVVINLFNSFSMGFAFGTMAWFMQYVVGDMSLMGVMFTVLSIPNFVGTIVGLPVSSFLEAKLTMQLSAILQAIATVVMWVAGPSHMTLLFFGLGAKAFLSGVTAPANMVLLSRIVDYGEWKNGVRQEGLNSSGIAVLQKITSAIAAAVLGFVIAGFGFSGGPDAVMPEAAKGAISFLYLGFPCITSILTAIFWTLFKLDEKTNKMHLAEIAARKAKQAAQ
ncbi:MAG: MFS transporter [Lachnospiraceae bacterium]|jgi:GPH family glycoside/pentoside/hexuronide:cation symporter|nr:MFS transporter [Lachnospiraceae bacterium]